VSGVFGYFLELLVQLLVVVDEEFYLFFVVLDLEGGQDERGGGWLVELFGFLGLF
jgi:hypothetical protein